MKRLTVMLNEIATLRNVYQDTAFDPVQFGLLCEIAGANGIAVTLTPHKKGIQERDARLLKDTRKTFLNIHIPLLPEVIKQVLAIRPEMVTFVDIQATNPNQNLPLSLEYLIDALPDILPDFNANNISVAVFVKPEINMLKQLGKMEIDYVEFDCSEVTHASDVNEQLLALDKLQSATLGAAKLGLGVNCLGDIDYSHLPDLVKIPPLEDICLGLSIIKRAFLVGVNQAIAEALQQIWAHQRG